MNPEAKRAYDRVYMRKWRAANRERARATQRRSAAKARLNPATRARERAWEQNNADRRRARRTEIRNPDRERDTHLQRTFGITLSHERAMLDDQGNACAVCRDTFDGNPRHRHIDHNHTTGKVRAVLCHRCNMLLGLARESVETLTNAITYLEMDK